MSDACKRAAEVERSLDARMSADETLSFAEHLLECGPCQAERSALQRLRLDLRELAPAPNAFMMRRLRRELLETANGAPALNKRPSAPAMLWRAIAMAGVLVAVIGLAVGAGYWSRGPAGAALTVTASAGAVYVRENRSDAEVFRLGEGTFEFEIRSQSDDKRLLFVVPDGEIEDVGTKFRVVVRGEHTEEISVSEGEIEFRRLGSEPMRLVANTSYRRVSESAAEASAEPRSEARPPVLSPVRDVACVPSSAACDPANIPSAQPAPNPVRLPVSAASNSRPTGSPSGTPAAATVASEVSPSQQSATPASSSPIATGLAAEDIAYMEIVRLVRSGKQEEAREAALRWLNQYPSGLRRAEVLQIAQRP